MLIPTKQVADLENLETGRGRVVWTLAVGDLGEARVKQADDSPRDRGQEFCPVEAGFEILKPSTGRGESTVTAKATGATGEMSLVVVEAGPRGTLRAEAKAPFPERSGPRGSS